MECLKYFIATLQTCDFQKEGFSSQEISISDLDFY